MPTASAVASCTTSPARALQPSPVRTLHVPARAGSARRALWVAPAGRSLAAQIGQGSAKGAACGAPIEALSDPALVVDQHRNRLVGHLPTGPGLPGRVVGKRVGDTKAALVRAASGHGVVVRDAHEAD